MKGIFLKSVLLVLLMCCATQVSYAQPTQASGNINGHEYVDLGLSVYWATCNVGASSSESNGNYYAWGEIGTKSTYTESNSATYKKEMKDIAGNRNYDVACANWGGTWRLPSKDELNELINNCNMKMTTYNGVRGMLFTSKINGKSIFLPAAGYRSKSSRNLFGEYGHYWSSSPWDSWPYQYANALSFNLYDADTGVSGRSDGRSVRPVAPRPSSNGNINGHEYVDMGLSVKWATCNIGANSPEEYGNYYAWGEVVTKSTYTEENFDIHKHKRDAAQARWGGTWRVPTKNEVEELMDNCNTRWTTHNGVEGMLFISRKNGNSIFLPAAGYRVNNFLSNDGKKGFYWSYTSGPLESAYALTFAYNSYKRDVDCCRNALYEGFCVRPVSNGSTTTKQQTQSSNTKTSTSQPMAISSKNLSTQSETINGHEYVDLGLSVKWATCNIGANSPSDYGNYYAWGEIEPKSTFTEKNSVTYKKDMGDMGDIAGNPNYDAARANWGGTWRLPTEAEIQELINKCKWTWTKQGGHKGYQITGTNGNSIFLPAAGYYDESLGGNCAVDRGNYWSSYNYKDDTRQAYGIDFSLIGFRWNWYYRYFGLSVRPVTE